MGGLGGLVHFRGDAPDSALLERMSGTLAARGPDGGDRFAEGPMAFVHRLRGLNQDRGPMPVVTDDAVLVMDGWIYDHTTPEHLTGPSAPASRDADTLRAAWARWGRRFVEHVEGDFAVAVWDRKSQQLHLVRDRFGIRPLFWTRKGGRFAFASTIPALLHVPWVEHAPDPDRLAEYLSFQVVHAPRTLLRDVRQVEPGHWLTVDADHLVTRRWWTPRYAPKGTARPRDSEIIDTVQEAVQRSVRRRVPQGTEVGLYLSGGLGSTAIAAAARRLYLNLPTFTLSFADDPYPELPFAGRVARLLGLEHHELTVGSADVAAAFEPTVRALGHPIGNPTAILQGLLAQKARERVRIVLSGDGGPELFGGRMLDRLQRQLRVQRAGSVLPRRTRGLLGRALGKLGVDQADALTVRADRLALEQGIGGANLFGTEDRRALLREPTWVRPSVRQDVLGLFHTNLETDPINTALHGFLRSWLGEGALARADRMATASGLDARFPLLDHEIVRYAAGLPGSVKVRRVGGSLHTRWPLRAMLDGVLPAPLVNRPRRGMPAPPDGWLVNAGRLFFEERWDLLCEDPFDLFDARGLEDLRTRLPSEPAVALQVWALFIFDAWARSLRDPA